jgi:hypothetical protein
MHRVKIKPEAEMEDITPKIVIDRLKEIPVPKID